MHVARLSQFATISTGEVKSQTLLRVQREAFSFDTRCLQTATQTYAERLKTND